MCGRFTLTTRTEELCEAFGLPPPPPELPLRARYNVAPSQDVLVIRNVEPRELSALRWGLVPSWAKDKAIGNKLLNARAETVAEKPSFRTALKRRRCAILADGFYEWRRLGGRKVPMHIRLRTRRPFAMAGLWETWSGPEGGVLATCTVITVPANELVATIHDRMPALLLGRDALETWLRAGELPPGELLPLLAPAPADELEAAAVSTRVNSPANDDPGCLEPAA